MPRSKNYSRDLHTAIISERLLRVVDAAIPDELRADLTWSAKIPTTKSEASTVSEGDIDSFIHAVANERGFSQVALEAFSSAKDISFYLYCEPGGSSLEYDCPDELQGKLSALAHSVQDLFHAERHWKHWIAIPFAPRSRLITAPKFVIGKQSTPFWRELSWRSIAEGVITNWISHASVLMIGLVLGFLLGKFAT